jgi:hypothetical protein
VIHDEYFELGGDSLGAASIVARSAAITGAPLSLRAALGAFTIADIAAHTAAAPEKRGPTPADLVPEVHLDPDHRSSHSAAVHQPCLPHRRDRLPRRVSGGRARA